MVCKPIISGALRSGKITGSIIMLSRFFVKALSNMYLQTTFEVKFLPSALKAEQTRPVIGITAAPLSISPSATDCEMKSWHEAPVSSRATVLRELSVSFPSFLASFFGFARGFTPTCEIGTIDTVVLFEKSL